MRYLPAIFVATMLAQVARADVGARSDYEDLLQSPDSRVSLAVVSPGSGFGMFGHAFAIVTRGRAPVTVGAAVSYRSDLRDNAAAGIPGLILAQLHLKGRAAYAGEAFAAGDLIREYSVHQGRTVTVYRLNLSPAQTRKFVDLMISDLADPDFSNAHDYNMATQNCFRRFVLHLNEVLPPAERVDARLIDDFAAPQPGVGAAVSLSQALSNNFDLWRRRSGVSRPSVDSGSEVGARRAAQIARFAGLRGLVGRVRKRRRALLSHFHQRRSHRDARFGARAARKPAAVRARSRAGRRSVGSDLQRARSRSARDARRDRRRDESALAAGGLVKTSSRFALVAIHFFALGVAHASDLPAVCGSAFGERPPSAAASDATVGALNKIEEALPTAAPSRRRARLIKQATILVTGLQILSMAPVALGWLEYRRDQKFCVEDSCAVSPEVSTAFRAADSTWLALTAKSVVARLLRPRPGDAPLAAADVKFLQDFQRELDAPSRP